jgi:hypothetical protein
MIQSLSHDKRLWKDAEYVVIPLVKVLVKKNT